MRYILTALVILSLSACGGALKQKNDSAFPYQYNQQLATEKPIKRIILASSSFGRPPLVHLQKGDKRVKRYVKNYLENHGYQILPSYQFDNAWKQSVRTFGHPFDPSTGKIDSVTWQQVMINTAKTLRQQSNADAIVFADVIEHEAQHNTGIQHLARFNGVSRKPVLKRSGSDGVPIDFDWNQRVRAVSLSVRVFTMNLENILFNNAGIDMTQYIDTKRSTPAFARRKDILKNESYIEGAIEIAFHPLIPMKYYPGEEQSYQTSDKPQ